MARVSARREGVLKTRSRTIGTQKNPLDVPGRPGQSSLPILA
jgi:hypothetical protein